MLAAFWIALDGLSALPQPVASDPLAALDDRPLSRRLAARRQSLPHAAAQGDAADNPDQRIADDIKLFVEQTLALGVGLLSAVVTLASFIVILWGLSDEPRCICSARISTIPGYLVWGALIYALFGTLLTHWIGSPLVRLNFQQQRFEADFRFNLVRMRENAEQIALLQRRARRAVSGCRDRSAASSITGTRIMSAPSG